MELDLKDIVKIIRKRIWIILSFVLIITLCTGIVSYVFLNPVYEASTKLIVKSNETQGVQSLDINAVNVNIRLIDTYKELIKTARIMDIVVAEHPEFELTAEQLIEKVRVSSVNNTQVMTLAVQDESYDKAAKIVNAVSLVFQNEVPQIMSVDNVTILNTAKVNANPVPVKPNPELNIAIAFVISLMLAVGLVFLIEFMDDTIKTEQDVTEILGLPTLTMIVKIKEEDLGTNKRSAGKSRQVGETKRAFLNQ